MDISKRHQLIYNIVEREILRCPQVHEIFDILARNAATKRKLFNVSMCVPDQVPLACILPNEVWSEMIDYMPIAEILKIASTSKKMRTIIFWCIKKWNLITLADARKRLLTVIGVSIPRAGKIKTACARDTIGFAIGGITVSIDRKESDNIIGQNLYEYVRNRIEACQLRIEICNHDAIYQSLTLHEARRGISIGILEAYGIFCKKCGHLHYVYVDKDKLILPCFEDDEDDMILIKDTTTGRYAWTELADVNTRIHGRIAKWVNDRKTRIVPEICTLLHAYLVEHVPEEAFPTIDTIRSFT